MRRTFKTICHNNIHRNYSSEKVSINNVDRSSSHALWKDPRPDYKGVLKIIAAQSIRDLQFEIHDLVIDKEYTIQISEDGYVTLTGMGEMMMFGSTNDDYYQVVEDDMATGVSDTTKFGHYTLFVTDRADGLYYREFFYSEEEMRDIKLNKILNNEKI